MEPVLLRLLLVVGLLAVVGLAGAWWQRRDGRVRGGDGAVTVAGEHLAAVGLDLRAASAGAVLLGSPTCAPCTAVKRVLGDLQAERQDFTWVYADAADHLDLAQAHRVLRVPTLLVVDAEGRLLARTSGVPDADDLRRVLDDGGPLAEAPAA
ncbi:thioredoxin family protein [Egicoccus sp. AB-alg2]|uniref:thioredoxin family protein n=1 Tax=Egicoccus sp. AB-alg2 TaxID=3242693 RepID=UPI00359DA5DC